MPALAIKDIRMRIVHTANIIKPKMIITQRHVINVPKNVWIILKILKVQYLEN